MRSGQCTSSRAGVAALFLTGLAGLTGASTAKAAPLPAGAAFAWGNNQSGQLGDGTTTNASTPVRHASASTYGKLGTIERR